VLWGGISGALAGFTTTPLDVVKTRIMTETHAGENRKFKVCPPADTSAPQHIDSGLEVRTRSEHVEVVA
jgi:hypothetical protein